MDNAERRMTTGRQTVEPHEDENNVYVNGFVIPKGNSQEDKNKREEETRKMYDIWCAENTSNFQYNKSLKDTITLENTSVSLGKVINITRVSYISTLAFYYLDYVLQNAQELKIKGKGKTKPTSKAQQELARGGGYMQELEIKHINNPFIKSIKLMIAVRRNGNKFMYSLSAIEAKSGRRNGK